MKKTIIKVLIVIAIIVILILLAIKITNIIDTVKLGIKTHQSIQNAAEESKIQINNAVVEQFNAIFKSYEGTNKKRITSNVFIKHGV